ncbi:MAG: glycosyltransferase family 9 protein [Candidatus Kapabacteria bacterium]|jgi:ADP-heptose:LPS heptosyltransferase|nr:glycosyltransferase family 9 protein [Candidatus Kapabacteria bacterium]
MKINITVLGRIGDMIIATAAFRAIKEKYPDAELHVLAGRQNSSVIENNPDVDKIRILDKSPLKLIRLISSLRKEKFDYYIDPKDHPSTESAKFAALSGANIKIGFNQPGVKIFDHSVASDKENYDLHFSKRCINTLEHIGIKSYSGAFKPYLFPAKQSLEKAEHQLDQIENKPIVFVNVSASNAERMFSAEKWSELINYILKIKYKSEYKIVINAAPAEKQIADKLKNQFSEIVVPKSKSMDEVIALAEVISERNSKSFMITPDTSLVHVASAFNMPIIAIYNGRDEVFKKFSPLSDKRISVRAADREWSIEDIAVKTLIEAIDKITI